MRAAAATALLVAVLAPGCTRSYVASVAPAHVAPATAPGADSEKAPLKRICVVKNPRVVGNFLEMYLAGLESRGYAATVVEKNPQPSECPLTSRYTAFNQLVRVDVYREGKPVGSGTLSGYYTDTSVKDLVTKLLP